MITKTMTNNGTTSLFRIVEERALSKKQLDEDKNKKQLTVVPYLPKDCISNILVRLPLESLQRSRFVCKPWYNIIYSPVFINAHLRRAETVLIFLKKEAFHHYSTASIAQEKPNTFSVEARVFKLQSVHVFHQPLICPSSKFYIKYMVIKNGKVRIGDFNSTCLGKIRATCNGLIVLNDEMKKGGLVIMNPVTRELSILPLGTLYPPHKESYGLSFCKSTGYFKLVHLFLDELNFIGCEILMLGTRSWKLVNGPAFGLFSWFGYEPISAIGALHWIPHIDHSEYIMSMTVDNEKFHKILLPKSSRTNDRIVEMGGHLCFVTHEEMNEIDVWILRNICGEDWTKTYTVRVGCIKDLVPLYCSKFEGEMIFLDKDGSLFAYDFQFQVMKKIDMKREHFPAHGCYQPHVNSLVSWQVNKSQNVGY